MSANMNETTGTSGWIGTQAVKVKNWNEQTEDEKLNALRDHVEWLTHRLRDAEETIRLLRFHQHSSSGDIVIFMRGVESKIEPHAMGLPTNLRWA
jgi:hypothetical protein